MSSTHEVMVAATLVIGNEYIGYHIRMAKEDWEQMDEAARQFQMYLVRRKLIIDYVKDAMAAADPLSALVSLLISQVQSTVGDAPEPGEKWGYQYSLKPGDDWD